MTVTVSDSGILFNDGSLQPTALTTGTQTIAGAKTFSSNATFSAGVQGALVLGTTQTTTSGTSIDFTSIPSWVKRITVLLNGVSLSGTSHLLIQIGAGSVENTGYSSQSAAAINAAATQAVSSTSGFVLLVGGASNAMMGKLSIDLLGSNLWVYSGVAAATSAALSSGAGGTKTTSGTLDRLRLTTVNGTDTFDAGSVNIMYEG